MGDVKISGALNEYGDLSDVNGDYVLRRYYDALRAENAKLAAALESIDTLVSEVIGADSGDRRILGKIEDEISAAIAKHRGE